MNRASALFAIVLASSFAGCTHQHLRINTLAQVRTVPSLQQQQVLDNLAMFITNPESLPFYSVAGTGTTAINDSLGNGENLSYTRTMFSGWSMMFSGSRAMNDNWSTAPINDPDKLKRMRCAYQIAVGYENRQCLDCCELERQWQGNPEGFCCNDPCRTPGPGWYCVGRKCDVPKSACFVGHHCDTYVWVPNHGVADFNNLTLTILDYATQAAPELDAPATQKVTRKWRAETNPVTGEVLHHVLESTEVVTEEPVGPAAAVAGPEIAKAPTPAEQDVMSKLSNKSLDLDQKIAIYRELSKLRQEQNPPQQVVQPAPVRRLPARENFYEPLRGLINLPSRQ